MSGSSEKDPWEAESYPDVLPQGWNMLCSWVVHLAQKVREGWVKLRWNLLPNLPAGLGKPHKAASPDGFPGVRLWLLPSSRNVERGRAPLPSPASTTSVNGAVAWCSAEQLRLLDLEVPTSLRSKTSSDGSVEWERSAG